MTKYFFINLFIFLSLDALSKQVTLTCSSPMDSFGAGVPGGTPVIQLIYPDSIKQLSTIASYNKNIGEDKLEFLQSSPLEQTSTNNFIEHSNTEFKAIKTAVNYVPTNGNFEGVEQVVVFAKGKMDEDSGIVTHTAPEYALVLFDNLMTSMCKKEFECTVCDE